MSAVHRRVQRCPCGLRDSENTYKEVTMYALAQLPAEQLSSQISNGLILLALGMAIVFLFLTILVFTTKGVSKVVRKFEKKAPAAQPAAQAAPAAAPAAAVKASDDAEVAVAIAAAMAKSRS